MAEFSYTTLDVSIDNHIAHVELSRPEKLNSMIPEFWHELPHAIRQIDESAKARVIVISSQGRHFSAGMDLSVFRAMAKDYDQEPARRAEKLRRLVLELQDSFNVLESVRIPVLAAVQGGVIGGAVDMVCACDMRYCTEDAFFTIKETAIGMTADLGTLQRIGHLMPMGLVKELAYTARNMAASEALSCGFVNQVFADKQAMLDGVMAIARQIAAHSPVAVAGCKQHINYSRDHSVADSLEYMATWQTGLFQMADIQAAMGAQESGTVPQFDDLLGGPSRMQQLNHK